MENDSEATKSRSGWADKFFKSLSWRVHASATTLIISYLYTGTLKAAGGIALSLMGVKFLLYMYHEALWERVNEYFNS